MKRDTGCMAEDKSVVRLDEMMKESEGLRAELAVAKERIAYLEERIAAARDFVLQVQVERRAGVR